MFLWEFIVLDSREIIRKDKVSLISNFFWKPINSFSLISMFNLTKMLQQVTSDFLYQLQMKMFIYNHSLDTKMVLLL